MKHALLGLLLISGVNSFAGAFDNNVDVVEIANAVAHCPFKSNVLVYKNNWIGAVEGKFTQVSKDVSSKEIILRSFKTVGESETAPDFTLTITQTLTQPPEDLMDAAATSTYTCKLASPRK